MSPKVISALSVASIMGFILVMLAIVVGVFLTGLDDRTSQFIVTILGIVGIAVPALIAALKSISASDSAAKAANSSGVIQKAVENGSLSGTSLRIIDGKAVCTSCNQELNP